MSFFPELWNSMDRLAKLITLANWGIAASLLLGFGFTVVAIKAGGRKDELTAAGDLRKAEQIAQLNNDTERLKSANLKLQTLMLPRRIIMGDRNGDKETRQARFAEVAKYAGTLALIQPVPDFEAQILAADIRAALKTSGWNAEIVHETQSHIPTGLIQNGVQIVTLEESPFSFGPPPEVRLISPKLSAAGHAAQAVVNLLEMDLGRPFGPDFWGVRWAPEYSGENTSNLARHGFRFPDGGVVILVGMRPLEYSLLPEIVEQHPVSKDK